MDSHDLSDTCLMYGCSTNGNKPADRFNHTILQDMETYVMVATALKKRENIALADAPTVLGEVVREHLAPSRHASPRLKEELVGPIMKKWLEIYKNGTISAAIIMVPHFVLAEMLGVISWPLENLFKDVGKPVGVTLNDAGRQEPTKHRFAQTIYPHDWLRFDSVEELQAYAKLTVLLWEHARTDNEEARRNLVTGMKGKFGDYIARAIATVEEGRKQSPGEIARNRVHGERMGTRGEEAVSIDTVGRELTNSRDVSRAFSETFGLSQELSADLLFGQMNLINRIETSMLWHKSLQRFPFLRGTGRCYEWPAVFGPAAGLEVNTPWTAENGVTIRELLNSEQLVQEGQELSHCVGGYDRGCVRGEYRILSLTGPDGKRSTCQVDFRQDGRPRNGMGLADPRESKVKKPAAGLVHVSRGQHSSYSNGSAPVDHAVAMVEFLKINKEVAKPEEGHLLGVRELDTKILAWEPFMPRWLRGKGPDDFYATMEANGYVARRAPVQEAGAERDDDDDYDNQDYD